MCFHQAVQCRVGEDAESRRNVGTRWRTGVATNCNVSYLLRCCPPTAAMFIVRCSEAAKSDRGRCSRCHATVPQGDLKAQGINTNTKISCDVCLCYRCVHTAEIERIHDYDGGDELYNFRKFWVHLECHVVLLLSRCSRALAAMSIGAMFVVVMNVCSRRIPSV